MHDPGVTGTYNDVFWEIGTQAGQDAANVNGDRSAGRENSGADARGGGRAAKDGGKDPPSRRTGRPGAGRSVPDVFDRSSADDSVHLQQQLPDRANQGPGRDPRRDGSRHAHHSTGWTPASSLERAAVVRRLGRPLGGRNAGGRHHEFHGPGPASMVPTGICTWSSASGGWMRETILYQFDVDDPTAFTRPWKGELTMASAPGPIYEYACNEGNYGLAGVYEARGPKRRPRRTPRPRSKVSQDRTVRVPIATISLRHC